MKGTNDEKKLLLINPRNDNIVGVPVNKYTCFPPLGLGILGMLTQEEYFDIKIIDENVDDFDFEDADLIGLTDFTCLVSRAYDIASVYRVSFRIFRA